MTTRVVVGRDDANGTGRASHNGHIQYIANPDPYQMITRPRKSYSGAFLFHISNELHEWFIENAGEAYGKAVELEYIPQQYDSQAKLISNAYWVLDFCDSDLALLFKLAWGGV